MKEISKTDLANKLGVSRPTLDKFLEKGFPNRITGLFQMPCYDYGNDKEYLKLTIENEIRLLQYKINILQHQIDILDKEV